MTFDSPKNPESSLKSEDTAFAVLLKLWTDENSKEDVMSILKLSQMTVSWVPISFLSLIVLDLESSEIT